MISPIIFTAVAMVLVALQSCSTLSAKDRETIPVSDHYDGTLFHNQIKTGSKSLLEVLKWRFSRTSPVEDVKHIIVTPTKPAARNSSSNILVTFVGHSTFLVQANNLNILTDPIWSERCSPVSFIGPKRLREPGIRFEDLPKIDVVVISHNHYDHMDVPTIVRLWQRDRPVFVVPLKNRETLNDAGITHVVEQDWWASTTFHGGLTVTAVPAQHWSSRWILDRNESLWAGFVLSFGEKNLYFAGDTGFGAHFSAIKERFGDFEVALIPIGAYLPLWFMKDHHLSPEDALKAAQIIKARHTIPMHYGTFSLGDDGFTLAEKALRALPHTEGTKLTILNVGDTHQGGDVATASN